MTRSFKIRGRAIGPGHPAYIVAELSGNHNQSYALAAKTVEAACRAGVDAIKLQTYTPDTLNTAIKARPNVRFVVAADSTGNSGFLGYVGHDGGRRPGSLDSRN